MFFLNMFLSATHFPSPALTAQAFQGLSLCRLLLYPGQACGSGVTTGKGRSHQLPAGKPCPCCSSPCLSSPHLQVPKSMFFSGFSPSSGDSGLSRECFLWDCERQQSSSLLSACCFKRKGRGMLSDIQETLVMGLLPSPPIIFG